MILKKNKVRIAILAALSVQSGLAIQPVFAQEGTPRLEEIIVTSSRRATNVQDTPIALSAFSAETLTEQNIENLQDITAVVPNVLVRGAAEGTSVSVNMRGIPNVGIYVDGVWQVSGAGLLQRPFVELERIEVLRGPQGTLYGRDSTGGAIQLFTKKPEKDFGAVINVGVGSFERRDVSASVDIPITDTISTKWTLANYNKEGYVKSRLTGINTGSFEDIAMRGDILWEPTDRFSMRLMYQEDDIETQPAKVVDLISPLSSHLFGYQVGFAEAIDIASGGDFNNSNTQSGGPGLGEFENRQRLSTPTLQNLKQITLHLDYQLTDELTFKYIYGGTDVGNQEFTDYGGTAYVGFVDYSITQTDLDSHEIQFTGDYDRFHWNVGVYSWDQKIRTRGRDYASADWVQQPANYGLEKTLDYATVLASPACATVPSDFGLNFGPTDTWPVPCDAFFGNGVVDLVTNFFVAGDDGSQETQDGEAYFGQITYDISDRWDVTFGVRYHDQTGHDNQIDVLAALAAGIAEASPTILGDTYASAENALRGSIVATAATPALDIGSGSLTDPISEFSFDNTSYRFGTSYDINDGVMVYLGYNEGFNAGGISSYNDSLSNTLGRATSPYESEIIESWEIGVRGDFLDNRLRVNATYFHTDWLNVQIGAPAIDRGTGITQTATITQNAATGLAKGLDLEVTYAATERLLLGLTLGFLDTKFTGFAAGAEYNASTDFTGAPENTYNFSAQYDWSLPKAASLMTRISYAYTSEYERNSLLVFRQSQADPTRGPDAGDYWMLNARAVFVPASESYSLSIYGNNLTNEWNLNSGFLHPIWGYDFGTVDASREIGLNLKMNF